MKILNSIKEINLDRIYVYGAGMVAEMLSKILKQHNKVKIEAFLVSDEPAYWASLQNIPNISISECRKEYPVVIATLSNQHEEISTILNMHGMEEYYAIGEAMFQEMRRYLVPERRRKAELKLRLNELFRLSLYEELNGIVISDDSLPFLVDKNIALMSWNDFDECVVKAGGSIFIPIVPWEQNWKDRLQKAFQSADEVLLSFRYGYLESKQFSLFEMSRSCGFKLVAAQNFFRKKDEYGTDVVLLCFRRTLECREVSEEENAREVMEGFLQKNEKATCDIGLVGNWSYPNYGTELTYYAFYKLLKELGYSVLMVEWPENSQWKPYGCTQLFEKEPYLMQEIACPASNCYEMKDYNKQCHMFIQGSDQLLHPHLYQIFGKNINLKWVQPDKKKIGYALSFGHEEVVYELDDKRELNFYLKGYDAISVREDSGVWLMNKQFGLDVQHVLDPIFLCNKIEFEKLANKYRTPERKLFAYIVDPDVETDMQLQNVATLMKLKLILFHDALYINNPIQKGLSVERWLAGLLESELVIADSFHAISFAILFRKRFLAIQNNVRGATRFKSILSKLGLENRLFNNLKDALQSSLCYEEIDYYKVENILEKERRNSLCWLKKALEEEHSTKYSDEYWILNNHQMELEARVSQLLN